MLSRNPAKQKLLADWSIEMPKNYLDFVNEPMSEREEEAIRHSVDRSKPYGSETWSNTMIDKYGLEATVRKRGRQIKGT